MSKRFIGVETRYKIKDNLNISKPILLLRSKKSFYLNGASNLIQSFEIKNNLHEYFNFSNDIILSEVKKAYSFFIKKKCFSILAIGGGSVIDMAKAIKFYANYFNTPNKDFFIKENKLANKIPIIAVPTTAGTGSEETHFATVYYKKKKYSFSHKDLRPEVAIVDPYFLKTVPKKIFATTGFDAFSQAIESYWSRGSTSRSRMYSRKAINLIEKNLLDACLKKSSSSSLKMSIASNLSGRAINISKTTAPHSLSYGINQILGFPHGHAVALTLGKFFKINKKKITQRSDKIKFVNLLKLLNVKNESEAENKWYRLMKLCGLNTNFVSLGLRNKAIIEKILKKVNAERLNNHPVKLEGNDLRHLFLD